MGRFLLVAGSIALLACAKPTPAPVETPPTPANPSEDTRPADGVQPDNNVGYGRCCKDDACEGQRYESAHAFAKACEAMGATHADWCPDHCDLAEEPYSCECG